MLFDNMTGDSFKCLIVSLLVCSFFYGWAMDAILGRSSFGVLPTAVFSAGVGYAALHGMDWAVLHHHVPVAYITPTGYLCAAMACATLALLMLALVKRLVVR